MPLTYWVRVNRNDQEYIVLEFTGEDKEDPFNWVFANKAFITALLCLMAMFIGLATTAYSSSIKNMCSDLGVST